MEDLTKLDDAELMRAAQGGNRRAFDEIVRRYKGRAFQVALGFLRNKEDALDLVQETFYRAYRSLRSFDTSCAFYPWFYRILHNCALTMSRRRRIRRAISLFSRPRRSEEERIIEIPDERDLPDREVGRRELRGVVQRALDQMDGKDREILFLRHFQNLSYQQIADLLAIPIGTVMSRLYYARRRLKEELDGYL